MGFGSQDLHRFLIKERTRILRRFTVLLSVIALALALPTVASATWMVVNLGSASTTGGNESGANSAAINDLGNVVATVDTGVGLGANTNSGIFYNKSTATTTNIGYLDSTVAQTYACGVNDSSQVVGYSLVGGSYGKDHAFIWTPSNPITDLTPQETTTVMCRRRPLASIPAAR